MGKLHRIDSEETIDSAIRLLAGLQADGWGLARIEHTVDYGQPSASHRALPVTATVTVTLRPAR